MRTAEAVLTDQRECKGLRKPTAVLPEDRVFNLPSEKETQFERLWEGDTPSGKNEAKAMQFKQKMRMALIQKGAQFNKENAKLYWMGTLRSVREVADTEGEFMDRRQTGRPVRRRR